MSTVKFKSNIYSRYTSLNYTVENIPLKTFKQFDIFSYYTGILGPNF